MSEQRKTLSAAESLGLKALSRHAGQAREVHEQRKAEAERVLSESGASVDAAVEDFRAALADLTGGEWESVRIENSDGADVLVWTEPVASADDAERKAG
jgi:hypothetical protein